MKKTSSTSRIEIWDRNYINYPDTRGKKDKNATVIQAEHVDKEGYLVEVTEDKTNDCKEIVIESLENAWSALARQYVDSPDETVRNAVNLIAGMVKEIKRRIEDYEESEQKKQEKISTQEWLDWLKDA